MIIDGHQDLIWYLENKPLDQSLQTNLELLRQADVCVCFGSIFVDNEQERCDPTVVSDEIEKYLNFISQNNLILIQNQNDLDRALNSGSLGLLLHLEGADALQEKNWQESLECWKAAGLRSVGIVWNNQNDLGSGASVGSDARKGVISNQGLTTLGRKVIQWLDQNDIIVDLSHMNEQTFWDTLEIVQNPPIITHGNARFYSDKIRNYSDDQIKAVAERGGLIGVCLAPSLIRGDRPATLNDIIVQIEYLVEVAGIDHVAFGSDFGGITADQLIPGAEQVTVLPTILKMLRARGWSETNLKQLAWKNYSRYLKNRLP